MRDNKTLFVWIISLFALFVLSGCGVVTNQMADVLPVKANSALLSQVQKLKLTADNTTPLPTAPFVETDILNDLEKALRDVYSKVNPSVVSVRVSKTAAGFQPQDPRGRPQTGAGSGFVWDTDGNIITNNHVIEDADKITIQFSDGRTTDAVIVGTDPDSDLAVVQVDVSADRLFPVAFSENSSSVGELAVAIGNPFGLDNTMTVGFISALGRSLPVNQNNLGSYTIPNIIQTDAPINPGNSGGVLVNSQGEVVGVTTAIVSPVQASAGIGFAIPSDIVLNVVPELIETGQYKHAWLGLSGYTLSNDINASMDLPADLQGVAVATVVDEGPADHYGLLQGDSVISLEGISYTIGGDIITAMDDEPITDFEDLVALLSLRHAGEEVDLSILREGAEMSLKITLGERPSSENTSELQSELTQPDPVQLGITGIPINDEIAAVMDLDADQTGVLVGEVYEGSVADKAGILGSNEPASVGEQRILVGGDIITAWNGDGIVDVRDLRAKMAETEKNDTVSLTVIRNGESLTLLLEF